MGGFEVIVLAVIVLVVWAANSNKTAQSRRMPCPNCGVNCTEPTNPEKFLCWSCHQPGPWATEEQVRSWGVADSLRQDIEQLLGRVGAGEPADQLRDELEKLTGAQGLSVDAVLQAKREAYGNFVKQFIDDELLTEEEKSLVDSAGSLIGFEWRDIAKYNFDLYDLLFGAWIRATGPARVKDSPNLALAPGELLTYDFEATFHEQVPVEAFNASTGDVGLSVPLGSTGIDIEAHKGGLSGTSVQVGTELRLDKGRLLVTTRRVVFLGANKSFDIPMDQVIAAKASTPASHARSMPCSLVLHTAASAENLEFSLFGAQMMAASIAWIKSPPAEAVEPPLPAPSGDEEFPVLSAREFARIVKDPDAAKGKLLTLYGRVIQFDTSTGPETFLCYSSGARIEKTEKPEILQFSENRACVKGSRELLEDVVKGDFFEAGVVVAGVYSYTTNGGGTLSCPRFVVGRISVYDGLG